MSHSNTFLAFKSLLCHKEDDNNASINNFVLNTTQCLATENSQIENPTKKNQINYLKKVNSKLANKLDPRPSLFNLNISAIEQNTSMISQPKLQRESLLIQKEVRQKHFNSLSQKTTPVSMFQLRRNSNKGDNKENIPIQNKIQTMKIPTLTIENKGLYKKISSNISNGNKNVKASNALENKHTGSMQRSKSGEIKVVKVLKKDISAASLTTKPQLKDISNTSNDKNDNKYKDKKENNKEKLNKMVDELEEHLNFLNRKLLNERFINRRLSNMKDQFKTEYR